MPALPSLASLKTFEAVVRHSSFALAAEEMSLTHSAISHQISKLESLLGVTLLDRTRLGAQPTAAGSAYLQRIEPALRTLESATRDITTGQASSLYVHSSPSLASLWLMPRLASFSKAHPDIALHLSASPTHSQFSAGNVDVDIRYGLPNWPGLQSVLLFSERITPLCSPALAERLKAHTAEDLANAPLIQSTVGIVQWQDWFKSHGTHFRPSAFTLRFDRAQLALDAATQGLGVALESVTLAQPYLADGRLIEVLPKKFSSRADGHHVVYPASHASRPQVDAFLRWLKRETKQQKKSP